MLLCFAWVTGVFAWVTGLLGLRPTRRESASEALSEGTRLLPVWSGLLRRVGHQRPQAGFAEHVVHLDECRPDASQLVGLS